MELVVDLGTLTWNNEGAAEAASVKSLTSLNVKAEVAPITTLWLANPVGHYLTPLLWTLRG
jgi:hypothetical protein